MTDIFYEIQKIELWLMFVLLKMLSNCVRNLLMYSYSKIIEYFEIYSRENVQLIKSKNTQKYASPPPP